MKKISRRNFLKTCAIAGSAAALTACGGSSSTTSGSAGNTSGFASSRQPDRWIRLHHGDRK